MVLQSCAFAETSQGIVDSSEAVHESIFTMQALEGMNKENMKSITYSPKEDAYYVILDVYGYSNISTQWVYASSGELIPEPQYPKYKTNERWQIVFDGDEVYSIENINWATKYALRLSGEEVEGLSWRMSGYSYSGILAQNGSLADYNFSIRYKYHHPYPIFSAQIGMPTDTTYPNSIHVWDKRYAHVTGYDFTADGKQIVYGGVLASDNEWRLFVSSYRRR